ncbi:MAG: DUF1292 domain-containing protein [Oscillospiraceae bacterium]|nr:DUF1292 domain-containing protein [Oscillospiraceae bacterium]
MSDAFGPEQVTIVADDGEEFVMEVVDRMDYNNQSYTLFLPAELDPEDPDYGFVLLREIMEEDGSIYFESIDDDDELQDVYERFMVFLYGDEDEEDETEE